MSEMVERVAKVLRDNFDPGWEPDFQEMARDAIKAMREPTDEMIWAAEQTHSEELAARFAWQSMIDVAIHGPAPATADPIGFDLPQGEKE
jgi:hypothetical protein